MSSHLFRRGGIWWARLAIPVRLREAAGRREFVQSCRTHELAVAKLVCAVLLSDWRSQILKLDSRQMTSDVLKLVGGSHALSGGGYVSLNEAAHESGISKTQLLRAVADDSMALFCRLAQVCGHVVPSDALDLADVMAGSDGGHVVPQPQYMPPSGTVSVKTGVFPVGKGSKAVADAVLSKGLEVIELVAFEMQGLPGMLFAPDMVITVKVGELEVLASAVDTMRQQLACRVSPSALERANAIQAASLLDSSQSAGKKATQLFSKALETYATTPSGIPGTVTSLAEQKQKRRGCALFIELVGDLPLNECSTDRFREFREKLKSLPNKVNNIQKEYRRETMAATVQALHDANVDWPKMTEMAQHERMQWLDQMFRWLVASEWLAQNPVTSAAKEQTKTAAERRAERQVKARSKADGVDDDSDDREPFTPDELRLIFGQPHFKTGDGSHVKGNSKWYPFEYWLPIIALHAGCRIKEVSQLYLSDIRQATDGVWYFDINETSPDKSLKNENATRHIPMSPVLVNLGLIEYRNRLEAEGYQRLFPELSWSTSDAKYAKEPKRKMSLMFDHLGMQRDGTKVFHCLRANFNDAMLRVPLATLPFDNPKLVVFAQMTIFGHKVNDTNGKHYTSASMLEKQKFVSSLRYDIPEIAKFGIDLGIKQIPVALKNKVGPRRGREDMGPLNDS